MKSRLWRIVRTALASLATLALLTLAFGFRTGEVELAIFAVVAGFVGWSTWRGTGSIAN